MERAWSQLAAGLPAGGEKRDLIGEAHPPVGGLGNLLGSSTKVQDAAELVREGGRASDTMDPSQTDAGTVTYNCTQ